MKHYDYSRGLKAPYSIQVIKSPKGKVLWVFSQPIGLSYFVALISTLVGLFSLTKVVVLPVVLGIDLNLLLFLFVPHKLARWYTETEIDGKKGVAYLKDGLLFIKKYVLDSREIYRFERVDEAKEFSFKRK